MPLRSSEIYTIQGLSTEANNLHRNPASCLDNLNVQYQKEGFVTTRHGHSNIDITTYGGTTAF